MGGPCGTPRHGRGHGPGYRGCYPRGRNHNYICIPLSNAYAVFMCNNIYIFIYYNYICIPLTKVYIVFQYFIIIITIYVYPYQRLLLVYHICISLSKGLYMSLLSCCYDLIMMLTISDYFTPSVPSPPSNS